MPTIESVKTHELDPHAAVNLGRCAIQSFDLTTLHNPDGSDREISRVHTYRGGAGVINFVTQDLNPDRTFKVN